MRYLLFHTISDRQLGAGLGNETKHVLPHLPQASGPPLLPLALDLLPAVTSLSLPSTTTWQCSLEGNNWDVGVKSMTFTFWILSQWYAQWDWGNWIMYLVEKTGLSNCYQIKVITLWNRMFTHYIYCTTVVCVSVDCIGCANHSCLESIRMGG